MYVYRIECNAGLGPYQGQVAEYPRHWDEYHPAPQDDGIPREIVCSGEYSYGFKSKTQLVNWFTKKDLKRFEEQGFYVMRYEVPKENVSFGRSQLCFKKDTAISSMRVKRHEFRSIKGQPISLGPSDSEGPPSVPPPMEPSLFAFYRALSCFLNSNVNVRRMM